MKRANGVGADAGQSVPRSPVVRRSTGPTPRASVYLSFWPVCLALEQTQQDTGTETMREGRD